MPSISRKPSRSTYESRRVKHRKKKDEQKETFIMTIGFDQPLYILPFDHRECSRRRCSAGRAH